MGINYGYIRVSTKEQNTDRQKAAFSGLAIAPQHIFTDKQSGKDFNRPQYRKLLRKLKKGDCLFIKSIDRLGRNYNEIIQQWQLITKKIKADIVVLDMELLDTRQKGKDLTGQFIADLVLQILSYVAQTERENIRQRQAEGIAAAKQRGVHFGNVPKALPAHFSHTVARWRNREISLQEACSSLQVSRSWFYKKVKEMAL